MQTNHFRIIDNGPNCGRARYTIETYVATDLFTSPEGTPGRGPYCVGWVPCKARDLDTVKVRLYCMGATPLPETL